MPEWELSPATNGGRSPDRPVLAFLEESGAGSNYMVVQRRNLGRGRSAYSCAGYCRSVPVEDLIWEVTPNRWALDYR